MKTQKQAVIDAVVEVLSKRNVNYTINESEPASKILSKEDKDEIVSIIVDGIENSLFGTTVAMMVILRLLPEDLCTTLLEKQRS